MNRRLLACLALAAGGLALVACATAPVAVPPAPVVAPLPPPSPPPVEGFDWFLQAGDGQSSLAYGVADSDDIRVSLDCTDGSRTVQVFVPVPTGSERVILLESGGETERMRATAEPSELLDGDLLFAEARSDLPVFQRFASVGWLAVWEQGERHAYAPHPGSQDLARRFLTRCG